MQRESPGERWGSKGVRGAWAARAGALRDELAAFQGASARRTAHHLFEHARAGVFVRVYAGALDRFVPFANAAFENTWGVRPREARAGELPPHRWWSSGYTLCTRMPADVQSDKHLAALRDMLHHACARRELPDCEFFVNTRDAPVVRRDGLPPTPFVAPAAGADSVPLLPVFSSYSGPRFFDVACPLPSDWEYATQQHLSRPPPLRHAADGVAWRDKSPACVWRGSLTGAGGTPGA